MLQLLEVLLPLIFYCSICSLSSCCCQCSFLLPFGEDHGANMHRSSFSSIHCLGPSLFWSWWLACTFQCMIPIHPVPSYIRSICNTWRTPVTSFQIQFLIRIIPGISARTTEGCGHFYFCSLVLQSNCQWFRFTHGCQTHTWKHQLQSPWYLPHSF